MEKTMRPTIHTVAQKAGVSIATVSRFLNGKERVRPQTADRIRSAIHYLGYIPNASARGLVMRTTETLALLFPKLSGPFYAELIRGAETEASASGYHLLIFGTSWQKQDNGEISLGLLATKVDGLIMASYQVGHDFMRDMQRQGVPVVFLGYQSHDFIVDSIRPENKSSATLLVSHLIEHGYHRIALIQGPEHQTHAHEREQGYRQALQNHQLPIYPEYICAGKFDEYSGYAAMQKLLSQAILPDAVFAANDQMAIGALTAITDQGLSCPDDIAMVGFDDIETARYLHPPLTTVHQDMFGQGQIAVRLLLNRIQGSDAPVETQVIPTKLVIRRSCGCSVSEKIL
jgi:LacI family transcriptional regulator